MATQRDAIDGLCQAATTDNVSLLDAVEARTLPVDLDVAVSWNDSYALRLAAMNGASRAAEWLVWHSAPIPTTLMHIAAAKGHAPFVKWLGMSPLLPDSKRKRLCHCTSSLLTGGVLLKRGFTDTVCELLALDGAPIHMFNVAYWAIVLGQEDVFNHVLDVSRSRRIRGRLDVHLGNEELFRAAVKHGRTAMVDRLLKFAVAFSRYPVDVHASHNYAFRHACGAGDIVAAKWIVAHAEAVGTTGSKRKRRNSLFVMTRCLKFNALWRAVKGGHDDVVDWLIGVSWQAREKAFGFALRVGKTDMARRLFRESPTRDMRGSRLDKDRLYAAVASGNPNTAIYAAGLCADLGLNCSFPCRPVLRYFLTRFPREHAIGPIWRTTHFSDPVWYMETCVRGSAFRSRRPDDKPAVYLGRCTYAALVCVMLRRVFVASLS